MKIVHREPHPVRMEPAGPRQIAPQAAEHLLVEHRHRRSGEAVVDDQPDRVGTEVDHADPLRDVPSDRSDQEGRSRHWTTVLNYFWIFRISRGARPGSLSALPRPDRLGLVMKNR